MRAISLYTILSVQLVATALANGQGCVDNLDRFLIPKNETEIYRSCEWAGRENTAERCEIQGVFANCPSLCDPSCPCSDSKEKFGIKDLKADLVCKDGKKSNGEPKKKFCNIKKFANQCPVTCKTNESKNKEDKKEGTIRTTVPNIKVKCDDEVQNWYPFSDYCGNFKFRYMCPQKCKVCPESFHTPSVAPSISLVPSSTPKPTIVDCTESRTDKFEIKPGTEKSCEWAARNETMIAQRCTIPAVYENCPTICNPSCPCPEDFKGEFGLKEVPASLTCEEGKDANLKKFCKDPKFNTLCTPTCFPDSPCAKKGTCKDKDGSMKLKVPTVKVTCESKPKDWYRGDKNDYCEEPKFKYFCPNKCNSCPTPLFMPSSSPSTTFAPSFSPSIFPSNIPSSSPSSPIPSASPSISSKPSVSSYPSAEPSTSFPPSTSNFPSAVPSNHPSSLPSSLPSTTPSGIPSNEPSDIPSAMPNVSPSAEPSKSSEPSSSPSNEPSDIPSASPSVSPSAEPSKSPKPTFSQ